MATVTSALGPAPGAAWHTDGYVVRHGAVDRATCEAVLARAGDASGRYHDPDGRGARRSLGSPTCSTRPCG